MSDKISNENQKPKRKLKVYSRFQTYQNGIMIVSEIRLTGKWLEKLGFEKGKRIELSCEQNKITITLFDEREL